MFNNAKKSKWWSTINMVALVMICMLIAMFSKQAAQRKEDATEAATEVVQTSEEASTEVVSAEESSTDEVPPLEQVSEVTLYRFRNEETYDKHFDKHGEEMGCSTKEEYLEAANKVINNPKSLHKTEAEDGDDVYYLEETNEIVFVSKDGYIRTYFSPKSGKKYYDKQ
ncbi:MAG: hypothetical protein K6G76_07840 [Lachnospiraceae bacterium]|nr:hypothetical protein [Lachnospiraceae bacterium]